MVYPYPDESIYICKYCKKKFNFSSGFNLPRLIEHLMKDHRQRLEEHSDLYISDLAKTCFELKRRS